MSDEGPVLEELMGMLADCPEIFRSYRPDLQVGAVAADLVRRLGGNGVTLRPGLAQSEERLILLACRVLTHPAFAGRHAQASNLLAKDLKEVSELVDPDAIIADEERREEFARRCVAGVGMRPRGETEAQALERLWALDTVTRTKALRDAAAAEALAQAKREELRRKREAEAAAQYNRE